MSGTDHGKSEDWTGPQPVMVLVRPQMGENIGAAARAMWNFGLNRMRIVDPRDGWPNPRAVAMASGAATVIDHVQVVDETAEALKDMTYVFATTARARDLTKPVLTPERAMQQARALIEGGNKVAFLFGPERAGLENADLVRADALISVPVNPAFGSLNLAQCVLLLAYEWRRQTADVAPEILDLGKTEFAEGIEVGKYVEHLESRLDEVGFFWPEHKAEAMRLSLRNMFARLPLTRTDIRMLHGTLRALLRAGPPRN